MTTDLAARDPLAITYSGKKQQVLEMLGGGLSAESVATALGVSPSLVSQLLSDEEFASAVTARRFAKLTKYNARDDRLDALEDECIKKLEEMLGMVYKPMEVARIFQLVNAAKRRGTGADQAASTVINNQVVNLIMPQVLAQKFHANSDNQVVEVVESAPVKDQPEQQRHSLVTMPATGLTQLAAARRSQNDFTKLESLKERVRALTTRTAAEESGGEAAPTE